MIRQFMRGMAVAFALVFAAPALAGPLSRDFAPALRHATHNLAILRPRLTVPVSSTRAQLQTQNNANIVTCANGCITASVLNQMLGNGYASEATLLDPNVFAAPQTFAVNPILSGCTGYVYGNAATAVSCASTVPTASLLGNLLIANFNGGSLASSLTFWRGDGQWATPSGSGNVAGPLSATNNHLALFSGSSGTIIKDGGAFSTVGIGVNNGAASPSCGSGVLGELCVSTTIGVGNNTITFTNGVATIGCTGCGPVGSVLFLQTTGSLPTNFAINTNYYVLSNTGSVITLAATYGGSAIVAGSAGSGTQTASAGSTVSTGFAADVLVLALGQGDWRCSGSTRYVPNSGVTATQYSNALGLASASSNVGVNGMGLQTLWMAFTSGEPQRLATGDIDLAVAAPTPIYLSYNITNSGNGYVVGSVVCRRID